MNEMVTSWAYNIHFVKVLNIFLFAFAFHFFFLFSSLKYFYLGHVMNEVREECAFFFFHFTILKIELTQVATC